MKRNTRLVKASSVILASLLSLSACKEAPKKLNTMSAASGTPVQSTTETCNVDTTTAAETLQTVNIDAADLGTAIERYSFKCHINDAADIAAIQSWLGTAYAPDSFMPEASIHALALGSRGIFTLITDATHSDFYIVALADDELDTWSSLSFKEQKSCVSEMIKLIGSIELSTAAHDRLVSKIINNPDMPFDSADAVEALFSPEVESVDEPVNGATDEIADYDSMYYAEQMNCYGPFVGKAGSKSFVGGTQTKNSEE